MNRITHSWPLVLVLIAIADHPGIASAAEPRTEHTYQLAEGQSRPAATLDDAAFLIGSWEGTAFGARFEQVWNPPSANTMVGMFKLYNGDDVAFYEIFLMTVEEGTLSLKVKHFGADFTAWEEKDEFIDFRLVRIDDDALHFGGLSFYQRGDGTIDGYIVMKNADGIREEPLVYRRRK